MLLVGTRDKRRAPQQRRCAIKVQKNMDTKEIFDSLVSNAIDFMTKSLQEIKEHPKSSVVNFFSSIELFFKARLLKEHWSLILKRPDKANISSFLEGEFQSIGINDTIKRLKNIAKESFSKDEVTCFEELRTHRNKLVHFFNPKYVEKPDDDTIYDIISEQCKGWFYLHRLLCSKWVDHFSDYKAKINDLNKLMQSHREFLRAKYEALQPAIAKDKDKGVCFLNCLSCGFESAREDELYDPLVEHECLVCGSYEKKLKIPCPNCDQNIYIDDYAEGSCDNCGYKVNLEYILEKYGPDTSTKDFFTEPTLGYCHWCERLEESVVYLGDELICLSCLEPHSSMGQCEWCGSMSTGDLSGSYYSGCTMCDGKHGWE